jgi:hypothetical protein
MRAGAQPARRPGRPAGRVTARHLTAARHHKARRARGPKRAGAEKTPVFSGGATKGSAAHTRGTRRAPCPHRPSLDGWPSRTARAERDDRGPTWTAGSTASRTPAAAAPPSINARWTLGARARSSPARGPRGQRTAQSRSRSALGRNKACPPASRCQRGSGEFGASLSSSDRSAQGRARRRLASAASFGTPTPASTMSARFRQLTQLPPAHPFW